MTRWALLALLPLTAALAAADVHPEKLSAFLLDRLPALKGFTRSGADPNNSSPNLRQPPQAAAAVNARCYHGPSELHYAVLLFPTEKALSEWDAMQRNTNPGWFSPLESAEKDGMRQRTLGGAIRPNLPRPSAVVVNRVVIIVGVEQHAEMVRRDPRLAKLRLDDRELSKRMGLARDELVRQAKALAANRGATLPEAGP